MPRSKPTQAWLLLALVVLVSAARNLNNFFENAELLHIVKSLTITGHMAATGSLLFPGQEIGGTSVFYGGPLYQLLHTPLMLSSNPVIGVAVLYFIFQIFALLVWIGWGLGSRLAPELIWGSALLLAWKMGCPMVLAENSTVFGYMTVLLFVSIAGAAGRGRPQAMILPGIILGLCAMIHLGNTLLIAPAGLLAVFLCTMQPRRGVAVLIGVFLLTQLPLLIIGFGPDAARNTSRNLTRRIKISI